MKAHVLNTDGFTDEVEIDLDDFSQAREIVGGDVELASVIYNGKPATLLVNDVGAMRGLQPNARATTIYWTATIKGITGAPLDLLYGALIHGVAILVERDRRSI